VEIETIECIMVVLHFRELHSTHSPYLTLKELPNWRSITMSESHKLIRFITILSLQMFSFTNRMKFLNILLIYLYNILFTILIIDWFFKGDYMMFNFLIFTYLNTHFKYSLHQCRKGYLSQYFGHLASV